MIGIIKWTIHFLMVGLFGDLILSIVMVESKLNILVNLPPYRRKSLV